MLHIVLADGTIERLADAAVGAIEGSELVCRDAAGEVVKTYHHLEALMFGTIEDMIGTVDGTKTKGTRYVVRAKFSGTVIATYEISGKQDMIEEMVERHRQQGHIVTIELAH